MPQTGSGHMQGRTQECGNKRTQESGNMHTHECTPKQTHAQPPSMTAHLGQPVGVVKLEVLELGHLGQPGATCLARLQCTRILHTHLAHASCTRILHTHLGQPGATCLARLQCTRILHTHLGQPGATCLARLQCTRTAGPPQFLHACLHPPLEHGRYPHPPSGRAHGRPFGRLSCQHCRRQINFQAGLQATDPLPGRNAGVRPMKHTSKHTSTACLPVGQICLQIGCGGVCRRSSTH